MTVVHTAHVTGFLDLTEHFRSSHPVLTNTTSTAAAGLVDAPTPPGLLTAVVVGPRGAVTGYLLHSPPWPALIPPMNKDTCAELATHITRHHPDAIPTFTGPVDTVNNLTAHLPDSYHHADRDNVRELRELSPQPQVPGLARPANHHDLELVDQWLTQFNKEAHLPPPGDGFARRLIASGRLRLWIGTAGQPVAMGAHHQPVRHSEGATYARIGAIYTPVEHRGHGYATAITWSVANKLRSQGRHCLLHAEADNHVSNHIYGKLGFITVAQTVEAHRA